jgi:alkylated DNA repair dioxygenase AlkB
MIYLDEHAHLEYRPQWLDQASTEQLLQELQLLQRQQEQIKLYGKWYNQPRLTAWIGIGWTAKSGYRQEGFAHEWTPSMINIREMLNKELHTSFNAVLLNEYRDGNDSVGWHADDEPNIDTAIIASISLGGKRLFKMRAKQDHTKSHQIMLDNGDLLVMYQAQTCWEHCIPKTKSPVEPRLNLTFRRYV